MTWPLELAANQRTWLVIKLVFSFLFFLSLIACDPSTTTNSPSVAGCSTTVAHIEVVDGAMVRLCGCQEAANTQFNSGQTLVCTVAPGTSLYFDFVGITVQHQMNIISIQATPIMVPDSKNPTQSFPILLNSPGTYTFYDIFFPTIAGTIVVQ